MAYSANVRPMVSKDCAMCEAHSEGFCGLMDERSVGLLAAKGQKKRYRSGDEVAAQGEPCDRVGILSSGLIKVSLISEDGENHVLHVIRPGQIVGDPSRSENVLSWEAATASEVCWITRSAFETMMKECTSIFQAYLEDTARQLEEQRVWVAAMRGRNALRRIAFWLLQQVPRSEGPDAPLVNVALTRRDLASLLDMTPETLCRGLHQLSDRNAITLVTADRVKITDIIKLRHVARCEEGRIADTLTSDGVHGRASHPFCISKRPKKKSDSQAPTIADGKIRDHRHRGAPTMTVVNGSHSSS